MAIETLPKVDTGWIAGLSDEMPASLVGDKASRLRAVMRRGYTVPAGWVVTNRAFEAFLSENELRERVDSVVESASYDLASLEAASRAIRELVLAARLPAELRQALSRISDDARSMGTVAVRSSAVGEDSEDAAFAGQLDSVLDVRAEGLADAIRGCWASYWSARSLSYQRQRGTTLNGMGVIIQQQVDARVSGVLFTVDPHPREGEDEAAMIVECCEGPCRRLVDGEVSPGRLSVSRDGREWRWRSSGDTVVASCRELFDDAFVSRLYDVALSLEQLFGRPQDIEWTVDHEGRLHVLQSRPITTLRSASSRAGVSSVATPEVWSNANVNENYPDPICPLLHSIASAGYYHYFRNLGLSIGVSKSRVDALEEPLRRLVGVHRGRLYYNLTNIHAVLCGVPFGRWLTGAFDHFVGADGQAGEGAASADRGRRGGRIAGAIEQLRIVGGAVRRFRRLDRSVRRFEAEIDRYAEETSDPSLERKTTRELAADVRGFVVIRCGRWNDAALADTAAMISYGLWKWLINREFPEADCSALHNSLLKGLRDVVSGQSVEHLWTLSRMVRHDDRLRELLERVGARDALVVIRSDERFVEFRLALDRFLEAWGFRRSGELMLTVPSYQERPDELLTIVWRYADQEGDSPAARRRHQDRQRSEQTRAILAELAKRRIVGPLPWPRKSWPARTFLTWTQKSIRLRERARLKQALLYGRLRKVVLELGRRLVDAGRLDSPEDVFMLKVDELLELSEGDSMFPDDARNLTRTRREAQRRFLENAAPPSTFTLARGEYWEQTPEGGEGNLGAEENVGARSNGARVLRGTGVCGGRVAGRAVVLRSDAEIGKLGRDDVLVTRQTDPGWAPVLFLARGLVMERGGMLSHGAILAREYGIPTVVGIPDVTELVQDGTRIMIDGDRGLVRIGD